MTDQPFKSKPATTWRRFPLTTTALAGSAIAIPLYVAISAMGSDTPAPAPQAAQGIEQTTKPQAALAPTRQETPPVGSPTAATPEAKTDAIAIPRTEGTPKPRPAAADAATTLRASAPAKAKSSRRGTGRSRAMLTDDGASLETRGAGFGGGGTPPTRRLRAERPEDASALAERDEEAPGDYDPQLRAGQLTAGLIDDLNDTQLLDELRAKALIRSGDIGSSIPSHQARGAAPQPRPATPVLEIGFVLDTTGSMGDELQYLKTEIRSIAEEIGSEYPNVEQRYGLVAYRDETDDYVVRHHDFEPLEEFVDHLGAEQAAGGGDFPEAMDQAMRSAAKLKWSRDNAAKLVFLVADAPPHTRGYDTYVRATGSLAIKGVSVYPIASSGVEAVCEYLMRWAARTTGGKYLFLTDHSGIGNTHADPHAPSYELKSLRDHMLGVIRDELGTQAQSSGPTSPSKDITINIDIDDSGSNWFDRHGLFALILGGVFMLGFAGDMAASSVRRRRSC